MIFAGGFTAVVLIAVWLYCLLDALTSDPRAVRTLPKAAWVLVVLLTLEVGAVLWLVIGRPLRPTDPRSAAGAGPGRSGSRRTPGGTSRPAGDPPQRRRSVAPDDDPEFLRSLRPPDPGDGRGAGS